MDLAQKLDVWHFKARQNKWLSHFSILCRIVLALGFLPSGMQKVLGERFTVLATNHPMGNFLDAFYNTGYYYTFVGIMQVLAALLLLIPRTVMLGALIYLPIILNICILSLAVRFDGSQITSPLMLCAVLFLLCWHYHRIKNIFPLNYSQANNVLPKKEELTKKFPFKFFAGVFVFVLFVVFHTRLIYDIMPRNTYSDCITQCTAENDKGCYTFCDCIHKQGKSLEICLEELNNVK